MTNPNCRQVCAIHSTGVAFEITNCDLKEFEAAGIR